MYRDQALIRDLLKSKLNLNVDEARFEVVQGGDTHSSMSVSIGKARQPSYFVKFNSLAMAPVLESEFHSLKEITNLLPHTYPRPILFQIIEDRALLVMPYLDLTHLTSDNAGLAGKQLAVQHQIINDQYGWPEDNFIGSSRQVNDWNESWPSFFRDSRLAPQLELAVRNNLRPTDIAAIETISENIAHWFSNYRPSPSLLHGDLWSGNIGFNRSELKPALFDPAPYFGDREADIAMTELFGSLPKPFYEQYNRHWKLDSGYAARRPLYNLYHALNHFVLFGHGYQGMVTSHTQELLRLL